jgi:hypothetical protein
MMSAEPTINIFECQSRNRLLGFINLQVNNKCYWKITTDKLLISCTASKYCSN